MYEQGRDRCQCYRSNAEVLERWMKCCFSVRDAASAPKNRTSEKMPRWHFYARIYRAIALSEDFFSQRLPSKHPGAHWPHLSVYDQGRDHCLCYHHCTPISLTFSQQWQRCLGSQVQPLLSKLRNNVEVTNWKGMFFLSKKLWKWDKKCKLQVGKKNNLLNFALHFAIAKS